MQAARALLDDGRTPTVAEVADEALVSRATAYRYFPSQEHLLLEVVLERSIDEIDRSVDAADGSQVAADRVERLVTAVHEEVAAHEAGFRDLLRLSVGQTSGRPPTVASIRGERRLHWIDQVLEPIAGELNDDEHRRLRGALALCVGAEAFVVLRDLCRLEEKEAEDTLRWAAGALVAAARADQRRAGQRR